MKSFTPRERVLAMINHKEADRIAISFAGTQASGINECPPDGKGYTKLCNYLGLKDCEEAKISEVFNEVGNVDERIKERFGSDLRTITTNPVDVQIEKDGTKTLRGVFCGVKVKKFGPFDDIYDFPLKNATTKEDIKNYPYWPTKKDIEKCAINKREEARLMRETTDYALIYDGFLFFPFSMYPLLTGYDRWYMDMKLNENFYFALSDKLLEIGLAIHDVMLNAVSDYVDIAGTYDDMGNQQGLLISRKDYQKFVKPYEKLMIDKIHEYNSNIKICRHSCGSTYDIIPDLIENGVNILNPVQPLAKNMEPWRLKKEFGKDITFCGGIDVQELLPYGTPEQVKESVKNTIKIFGKNGGYILGPAQNIGPDVPPENIVAMYDAALEYGRYPL
jgi:uroporphyrinogen decarboxylase